MSSIPYRRPYLVVAHAFSQLTYKKLPQPFVNEAVNESSFEQAEIDLAKAFVAWSFADWLLFIKFAQSQSSGYLPWFSELWRQSGLSPAFLAEQIYQHLQKCCDVEASYLLWGDADYPPLLAPIEDPPLGLTLLGNRALLSQPCLAVVGSRKASAFALSESHRLGQRLAQFGVVTVSGGAYGCDIAAHQGVLSIEGQPVNALVVFAGGLSELYPQGNRAYFRQILQRGGLLLSERLWSAPAKPADFPIRNRIISGLAWELIVMQAGKRSGALVTARRALDQGREILVLRHQPHDVRAEGSCELIADGAYAFSDVDDLLCSYRFFHEVRGWHGGLAYPASPIL